MLTLLTPLTSSSRPRDAYTTTCTCTGAPGPSDTSRGEQKYITGELKHTSRGEHRHTSRGEHQSIKRSEQKYIRGEQKHTSRGEPKHIKWDEKSKRTNNQGYIKAKKHINKGTQDRCTKTGRGEKTRRRSTPA